jgi:hypothetical protein
MPLTSGLFLSEFVIHRPVEVVGDPRDSSRRDQRGHGDEAAIAGREIGTQPQISERVFGRVLDEARSRTFFARCASAASSGGSGALGIHTRH